MIHQNLDLLVAKHLLPALLQGQSALCPALHGGGAKHGLIYLYQRFKLLEFFLKSSYFYITGLLMTFFVFIALSEGAIVVFINHRLR